MFSESRKNGYYIWIQFVENNFQGKSKFYNQIAMFMHTQ